MEDYSNLSAYIKSIDTIAARKRIDPLYVLSILDDRLTSIIYSYLWYKRTGEIRIYNYKTKMITLYKKNAKVELEPEVTESQAASYVDNFSVAITGARAGDTLSGQHSMCKDAMVEIMPDGLGYVPINMNILVWVMMYRKVSEKYIDKLATLPFFENRDNFYILWWCMSHAEWAGEYLDLTDYDITLKVKSVGTSKMANLESETVETILRKKITTKDLMSKFPFKPGSKGLKGKQTLMFRSHLWKLYIPYESSTEPRGVLYSIVGSKLAPNPKKWSGTCSVFDDIRIGDTSVSISVCHDFDLRKKPNLGMYKTILLEYMDSETYQILIAAFTKYNFTPGGYKSLIQKLIRYSPVYVKIGSLEISSEHIMMISLTLLLLHPGSFVPDIKRYVRGNESGLKRLLVSILEDSWAEPVYLLRIAIMVFVASQIADYLPGEDNYRFLIRVAISAITERKYFVWDAKKGDALPPYGLKKSHAPLEHVSMFLDYMRSFGSDLALARYIAYHKGEYNQLKFERPKVMDLYHCVDQHWLPDIGYLFDSETVKYADTQRTSMKGEADKPYVNLFKLIFWQVTGVNTRKGRVVDITDNFVKKVKKMQNLLLESRVSSGFTIVGLKALDTPLEYNISVSDSWLAGMMGSIEIPGKPKTMVTLDPNNIYQMKVTKKPVRGVKSDTLEDEVVKDSINKAIKILTNTGVTLNASSPPIESLKGYKLFLKEGKYVLVKNKKGVYWDSIKEVSEKIPVYDSKDFGKGVFKGNTLKALVERAILVNTPTGIVKDADTIIRGIFESVSESTLVRLYHYLGSKSTTIEIDKLSKSGGGTDGPVTLEDGEATKVLLALTTLYPYAIKRRGISTFDITFAPIVWDITEIIVSVKRGMVAKSKAWKPITDSSGRIPRDYQLDTLKSIIARIKQGKHGHFIWLTMGLGKTMIAALYIQYLIKHKSMPSYLIYTLPKSAMERIIEEFEFFGVKVNVMIPIKGWKKSEYADYVVKEPKSILPGHVNIILHDHLRLMHDELYGVAQDTIFIVDEVHKAMNNTQRSSIALQLAILSKDFLAMTGTPVVDADPFKLISWLRMIVNFEVTDKSFWVAVNAMISKKVKTNVDVVERSIEVRMLPGEKKRYEAIAPVAVGGKNSKASNADVLKAFEICYGVCDRAIVKQTLKYVDSGERVMVVTRSVEHQTKIVDALESKLGSKRVHAITSDSVISLNETNAKGKLAKIDVVVTTLKYSEGYDLTRMGVMITAPYFSNQANREQLMGRINRINQTRDEVTYITVHTGIVTYVLKRHTQAASMSAVLASLAKEVKV